MDMELHLICELCHLKIKGDNANNIIAKFIWYRTLLNKKKDNEESR
jgi:hypothetical protein